MSVRIYFRGLILFRFPTEGDDKGKLVAELLTEPLDRGLDPAKVPPGQDDHDATIQVITGEDVRRLLPGNLSRAQQLLPHSLNRRARVEITIPGCQGGVQPLRSFTDHVPKIDTLAQMAGLKKDPGINPADYLRATVVVNCGTIRVNDVVTWDNGFPLPGANRGDTPSAPAEVKFCGVESRGHAANECVLEADGDVVEISSLHDTQLHGSKWQSTRQRNQVGQENTTDILIDNFEYQRARPVPWGLDFQWLFARLGYGEADLGAEVNAFKGEARKYDKDLLAQDEASMLRGTTGRPFPYIVSNKSLVGLNAITYSQTRSPLTGTKSRPLCVPGTPGP